MGGAARAPEHRVRCLTPVQFQGGNERLPFEVDGREKAVSLRIGGLTRSLATGLPDWARDLLEIAALVYGVDSAVSRGGPGLQRMGQDWYRGFEIEMPVRDPALWSDSHVKAALEETLAFLSGDRFAFSFTPHRTKPMESLWFDFGPDTGWQADRVVMFSGGLDSFAGALEEIVEHCNKVALVSHFSSTKLAPVQRALHATLRKRLGEDRCRHFPMQIQLSKGTNSEGTHRTRSFLFGVLGLITALAFRRDRVSFHENGVVSLNLPPVANVLNTRATRTTHPRTLALFSKLFEHVCADPVRIDNPFFWRTKTEVLQTIGRLGMADQITATTSCADTHNRSKQHPHCGRCSQCIDRRFAVLASGLDQHDPEEAYAANLMERAGTDVRDREAALSYVRNALLYETTTPEDLRARSPAVLSAVSFLGEPPDTALRRIADLYTRHGRSVASVMRDLLSRRPLHEFPADSLPRLFGDVQRSVAVGAAEMPFEPAAMDMPEKLVLVFDRDHETLTINDKVKVTRKATYGLLEVLARAPLEGAGKGWALQDYPLLAARQLRQLLNLENEESVRRRISRAHANLRELFASAGLDPELGNNLIENVSWHGYRLRPELVEVRFHPLVQSSCSNKSKSSPSS